MIVAEKEVLAKRLAESGEEGRHVRAAAVVADRLRDAVPAKPSLERREIVAQLLQIAAEEVAAATLVAHGGVGRGLDERGDFGKRAPRAVEGRVHGGDVAVFPREKLRPAPVLAAHTEGFRIGVGRSEPEVDAGEFVVELDERNRAAVRGHEGACGFREGREPAARLFEKKRVHVGDRGVGAAVRAVGPPPAKLRVVAQEPVRESGVHEFRILVGAGPQHDLQAFFGSDFEKAGKIALRPVAEANAPLLGLVDAPRHVGREEVAADVLPAPHPAPPVGARNAEVVHFAGKQKLPAAVEKDALRVERKLHRR